MIKQISGESAKAFEAFSAYIALGEGRTQKSLAKNLGLKDRNSIAKWSVAYKWKDRLAQHLADEEKLKLDAREKAALEQARENERRRERVSERAWDFAEQLFEKANEMLKWPIVRKLKDEQPVVSADGKTTIYRTIINPSGWRWSDIAKVGEVADSLSRLAIGMPQKHTALSGPSGEALQSISVQPIMHVVFEQTEETLALEKQYNVLPD